MSDDVVIEEAPAPEDELAPPARGRGAARRARGRSSQPEAEEEAQPAAEVAPEAPPEEIVPDEAPSEGPTEEPPAEETPPRKRRPRRIDPVHRPHRRDRGGEIETLAAFERLGAATLSTDRVTHELLDDDQVRAALIERWGRKYARRGRRSQPRRGDRLLDPDELAFLEGCCIRESAFTSSTGGRISAPTWRSQSSRCRSSSRRRWRAHSTLPWRSSPAMRSARLGSASVASRGLEGREGRQLNQGEKERRADHVIRNEGSIEELESKVSELIDQIKSETADEPWRLIALGPLALQSQWQPLEQAPHGSDDEPTALTAAPPRDGRRGDPDRRGAGRLPDREQRPLPANAPGGHPPASPRGHHPPAGEGEGRAGGSDRRRDLCRVSVQGSDIRCRRSRVDADHPGDCRPHRKAERRTDLQVRGPCRSGHQHPLRDLLPRLPDQQVRPQHGRRAGRLQRR